MNPKYLKIFAVVLILISWVNTKIFGCAWYEESESYRVSVFQPEYKGLIPYRPFYYSSKLFYSYSPDIEGNDRKRNVAEWIVRTGPGVKATDVDFVLYRLNPDVFINSFEKGSLKQDFAANSFVEFLIQKKNSELLSYLVLSKKIEFLNFFESDPWDFHDGANTNYNTSFGEVLSEAQIKIEASTDIFLKKRYTYQACRLLWYLADYDKCLETFNRVFTNGNENSIIYYWALLYKAQSLDGLGKGVEANYWYSLVFSGCDEKKLRCFQLFHVAPKMVEQTLDFAKSNQEKAVILGMSILGNPGPCLEQLKRIYDFNPSTQILQVLLKREVNKLEDWLLTPTLTSYSPSINSSADYDYEKYKAANLKKDSAYAIAFSEFIEKIASEKSSGFFIPYANLIHGHLLAMQGKFDKAIAIFNSVKHVNDFKTQLLAEDIFIAAGQKNSDGKKEEIAAKFEQLNGLAKSVNLVNKVLYSLCFKFCKSYEKTGDFAISGLFCMKGERYKNWYNTYSDFFQYHDDEYWSPNENYYLFISYFDTHAGEKDLDNLINLMNKKNRTKFESYLCDQPLGTINAYKDLRGTLAFRNGNLNIAFKTFSEIPDTFWTNVYEFKNYLCFDAKVPKCYGNKLRKSVAVSKTRFVKEILDLETEAKVNPAKRAENYLKLGNIFYNCTYWGNSWMMMQYGWSVSREYASYYSLPSLYSNTYQSSEFRNNYFNCKKAEQYYKKSLDAKGGRELQAEAWFMLHECDYSRYLATLDYWGDDSKNEYHASLLRKHFSEYTNTRFYEQIKCPGVESFLAGN